jgi:hypothetical protein
MAETYKITIEFKRDIVFGGSELRIEDITPKMSEKDAEVLYGDWGLSCPDEFEKK